MDGWMEAFSCWLVVQRYHLVNHREVKVSWICIICSIAIEKITKIIRLHRISLSSRAMLTKEYCLFSFISVFISGSHIIHHVSEIILKKDNSDLQSSTISIVAGSIL
jgi:hypothetical protein